MTDRADTILQVGGMDTFTVINTGVDDECIAVDEDVYNGGNRRLVLIDVESANLVERKSDDGIVSISTIQPIVTLIAGLIAIVSGIMAIRYYYNATKKVKND